ncbi:transporter substrate-binding domain-containing protein, partial [Aeromonas caviae]|uniref:transporter substrate-binding domain-containing protein n=1 Tax=Aeromonas caviae TaxID=648 RepID=UPI00283AA48C
MTPQLKGLTMKLNTLMMLMALATAGQAAAKPLVIATDATYPPFEMVDSSGKLGGFEVDLAYAL